MYFPGSYIPQAVAILVGEKFHLKVWRVVNLAKALNLVAIFGMLALAARLWRLPLLTAVLLLMPMTLFSGSLPVNGRRSLRNDGSDCQSFFASF